MSPLLLVGILVITSPAFADVKHVLEGSAHPPEQNSISPHAVNYLATNTPTGEFWWMNSDSPLKAAYDYYKKCSTKGNCITAISPPPASQPNQPNQPNQPTPHPFRPQDTITIDINKNPFFNGNFQAGGGNANFNKGGSATIDISKNPFLSGAVVTTGNGAPVVKGQDGFIGVQPAQPFAKNKPGFATSHPLEEQKKPFASTHPLDNNENECRGKGFVCTAKDLCVNGVVNKNGEGLFETRSDVHYCSQKETCCQLDNDEISTGKSSVPLKLSSSDVQPFKPELIFLAGEHGHHSSTPKTIRDTSVSSNSVFGGTVDYSDVKFADDVRFPSTFQGPAYLPPVGPTTKPTPRPFQTQSPSINQHFVNGPSSTTPRPRPPIYSPAPSTNGVYLPPRTTTGPFTTQYVPGPSVTPQRPYQPQTTSRPYQPSYQPTQTTSRPYQPPQTTSRPYQPSYQPTQTTSRPYQPPQTTSRPYQPSYQPTQTTSRPYRPPQTTTRPYQPSYQPTQTTSRPYQPPQTTSRPYQPSYQPTQTTSRPYQPPQTTFRPYQPPSQPPQTLRPYQPSTIRTSTNAPGYLPPRPEQSSPRPNPFVPQQTTPRPTSPQFRPTPPPFRTSPPVTPGYQYPSPSQPQPRPTPSPFQPRPTPSQQYPSPSQPQPRPTPSPFHPGLTFSPQYPSPNKPQTPFPPRPTPGPSTGYPQYPSPSQPSPSPYQPRPTPSQPRPTSPPFQPRPTPGPSTGYQYPTPSPSRPQYPSPSQPSPSPYQPRPTPSQPRPTLPPFQPRPTPGPTTGYQYPTPSPSRPQYPTPSQPSTYQPGPTPSQQYPSPSQPQPSIGYQYPTPSTPRPNPFIPQQPSTPLRPGPSVTIPQFVQPSTPSRPSSLRPYEPTTQRPYQPSTQQPYQPNTQVPYQPSTQRPYQPSTQRPYVPPQTNAPNPSGGYVYPKPTPSFEYPTTPQDGSGSDISNQYIQKPTRKPPTGYLPPSVTPPNPDQTGADTNITGIKVPIPTSRTPPFELNTAPPSGCAAALKCVQEIYCTAEGVVSPVPVVLTKQQEANKVPTTVCQDTESGIIGKCCRDPNYKDPWPSANLVDGVDDGQYKEDDNLGQYQQDLLRNVRSHKGGPKQDSSNVRNRNFQPPQPTCGERHLNSNPPGVGPLDVNFAEIPWQAMVLRDSNRSLLCGGVIVSRNAVLTAAHCVEGLETSDILIKGGEWKLGIDEEPLPFQIVNVAVVVRHPQYQPGSFVNDLALLVLQEKLRLAKNVGTICLPQPNQIPTENCIATGWGKRILQLHAKGAIMHSIDVKIMDNAQCQETLASKFQHAVSNYSPNTLCGFSNRDQCKVDYGSALACSNGDQYVLSGIYSWDTGCKQEGQIGGYIAPDVEWIESTLAKPISELRKLEQRN